MMAHLHIFLLSLFYFLLHSFFAADRVKAFVKKQSTIVFRFYRIIYSILNVILFTGLLMMILMENTSIWKADDTFLNTMGIIFFLSGTVVMLKAFSDFDVKEFIGISFLKKTENEKALKLSTKGLYAYVRHPLYFALILMLSGSLLYLRTMPIMLFVIATFVYLPLGIYLEEKKLVKTFGADYLEYQKEVKMLLPWIL